MRVLICVTHLLGSGHLSRALALGREFVAKGHNVTLISGGMPAPQFQTNGVELVQLPPVRSDGVNFTRLLDEKDEPATTGYMARRRDVTNKVTAEFHPDAIITELYPFGRRVLELEFQSMLKTAQLLSPRPAVLASVRDILAPPSHPEKAMATEMVIDRFYDGILVHSDEKTTALSQSWPVSDALAKRLIYTGYVTSPAAKEHPQKAGLGEVLVSAGGGSVGGNLFETAIEAAKISGATNWRLLVGGRDVKRRIHNLQGKPGGHQVTIEPARPDFRQMLAHVACSVSMCGYNTALDLLQAGCPGVFVPFDEGGEVEQSLRADALAKRNNFTVIPAADLTAKNLLTAVGKCQIQRRYQADDIGFEGAAQTVRIVEKKVAKR